MIKRIFTLMKLKIQITKMKIKIFRIYMAMDEDQVKSVGNIFDIVKKK